MFCNFTLVNSTKNHSMIKNSDYFFFSLDLKFLFETCMSAQFFDLIKACDF